MFRSRRDLNPYVSLHQSDPLFQARFLRYVKIVVEVLQKQLGGLSVKSLGLGLRGENFFILGV